MSTADHRLSDFVRYRNLATEAARTVERLSTSISDYAANTARSLGANGRTAVVSLELSKDIPFMDMVGDRNRYIQLSIMYSNLALLHRNEAS
jgi:hypothetical protein